MNARGILEEQLCTFLVLRSRGLLAEPPRGTFVDLSRALLGRWSLPLLEEPSRNFWDVQPVALSGGRAFESSVTRLHDLFEERSLAFFEEEP